MRKYLKYLSYLIRHKWYVAIECWRRGLYWQGLTHDMSKFLPSEYVPYAKYFYSDHSGEGLEAIGEFGLAEIAPWGFYTADRFDFAWLLHQKRNKHHWQWWILKEDSGVTKYIPISDRYRKEMICDWIGAGKAIHGKKANTKKWYRDNREQIKMNSETKKWVDKELGWNPEGR